MKGLHGGLGVAIIYCNTTQYFLAKKMKIVGELEIFPNKNVGNMNR